MSLTDDQTALHQSREEGACMTSKARWAAVMSRRPLAKPACGPTPWDKLRRGNAGQDQLVPRPPVSAQRSKTHPSPTSRHLLQSPPRSRPPAAQGIFPGSAKEGLSSALRKEQSLVTLTCRGLSKGVTRWLSVVSLWQKRVRGSVCTGNLGCKSADTPSPFLQGPSISPAVSLEPHFSKTCLEALNSYCIFPWPWRR